MKNPLPNWVEIYKTKGKTIKVINDKYYLYEQKCIYDASKKHKNNKKDIYLGRITQDNGFIPAKTNKIIVSENIIAKTYGPYALINHCCSNILERLESHFGEYANIIFTIAALRTIEKTPYYDLEDAYNSSYFSIFDKTLGMSKSNLSRLLEKLAKHKDKFSEYMKNDIENDDILIFDGTNLLCGSQNISFAASGYKHGHNYSSQVNALYAYSGTKKKPVYYKLFEGSISDAKSLSDLLMEAGIENGIAIVDNGFASEDNLMALLSKKEKYILALRRDSKYVTDGIAKDYSRKNAKEKFVNNKEAVYAYETKDEKGNRICVYFNQTIAGVETTEYLDKMSKDWKGYTEENFERAKERFGIYVIKTNIEDMSLQQIYEYYKSRFEIEYMFDTVKNTLEFDKVYMHSDETLQTWMFINHISICMSQQIYDLLKEKEVNNVSLRSLFKKLRQVVKQKSNLDPIEKYELQVIPAKTKKLLANLNLTV